MPRIECWSITGDRRDQYTAPELRSLHLQGCVYGHPRFDYGHTVRTTAIVSAEDGTVRTKSGSSYEIGDPSPMYEDRFPNARDRLFAVLQQGEIR